MTDRPIIFKAAMVNAILEGRKTQTRRVLKPQPTGISRAERTYNSGTKEYGWTIKMESNRCSVDWSPPKFQTGDHLWVHENCSAIELESGHDVIKYPSNGDMIGIYNNVEAADRWGKMNNYGNRRNAVVPSIHMPRWASRLTLVVTDVRVQRLHEISKEDAIAEGLQPFTDGAGEAWYSHDGSEDCKGDPREAFQALWDSINEPHGFGWDSNPWVVAITFETHRCNIDQMEAA